MSLLSYDELVILNNKKPQLVENMISSKTQIQIDGIELTLKQIETYEEYGEIGFDNSERKLPKTKIIEFDNDGWIYLQAGIYKILFNEIVNIPKDLAAIARPRSSLLRCGVTVETAVWDSGYSGRSESLLVVYNKNGFKIKKNSRMIQLLFFRIEKEVKDGYSGIYQNENI